MPGHPRIDKGEGLIRTHDLLQVLKADIGAAYEVLEADRQSQYLRRCVVRAVFSILKQCLNASKVEVRSTVRLGHFSGTLTEKEQETIGPLLIFGRPGKFLPLDQNIKRTFRVAAKIWGLEFRLDTNGRF